MHKTPEKTYIPSPQDIMAKSTNRTGCGWTKDVLAEWGIPCPPPPGWRKRLEKEWYQANGKQVPEKMSRLFDKKSKPRPDEPVDPPPEYSTTRIRFETSPLPPVPFNERTWVYEHELPDDIRSELDLPWC